MSGTFLTISESLTTAVTETLPQQKVFVVVLEHVTVRWWIIGAQAASWPGGCGRSRALHQLLAIE